LPCASASAYVAGATGGGATRAIAATSAGAGASGAAGGDTGSGTAIAAGGAAGAAAVTGFDALGAACSLPHAGNAINANKMQRNCDFIVVS
jgi:hypothetical protein